MANPAPAPSSKWKHGTRLYGFHGHEDQNKSGNQEWTWSSTLPMARMREDIPIPKRGDPVYL